MTSFYRVATDDLLKKNIGVALDTTLNLELYLVDTLKLVKNPRIVNAQGL
jgi:hypothetical protein